MGYTSEWLIDLLSNKRRRLILRSIKNKEKREISLNEIVDDVIQYEEKCNDKDSISKNSVRVSLRQNHIPKLIKNEVVDYNEDEDIISKSRRYDEVVDILIYLDGSTGNDDNLTRSQNQQITTRSTEDSETTNMEVTDLRSQTGNQTTQVPLTNSLDTSVLTKIILVETTLTIVLVMYMAF